MNEQFGPHTYSRMHALHTYMLALERGDLDIVTKVWRAAEQDAVLERLLLELHDTSLETIQPIHSNDLSVFYGLLHTYPGIAKEVGPNGASSLKENVPHQEELAAEWTEPAIDSEYPHFSEQEERSSPRGGRYFRLTTILQSLAAVLLVAALLSGFVLLLAHHPSSTGSEKNFLVTVATSDGTIYGLQSTSGAVLWRYAMQQQIEIMVQQGGAVYAASLGNAEGTYLSKIRASDGKLLWMKYFPQIIGPFGIAVDDNAIAMTGSYGVQGVNVVSAKDGSLLWQDISDTHISYAIIAGHNHTLYVQFSITNGISGIKAFQFSSGKLLWTAPALFAAPAVFSGNIMYIGSGFGGTVTKLDINNGKVIGSLHYPTDEYPFQGYDGNVLYLSKGKSLMVHEQLCALRLTDGAPLWCSPKPIQDRLSPPVIMNDTVYYAQAIQGRQWQVVALDADNGTLQWHTDEKVNVNVEEIAGAYGIVFLATSQGLIAFSGSDGHVLWRALTGTSLTNLPYPAVSVPDGQIGQAF
ncbi:MAG: PQQ-binding-like beta-propeller repeat protein [Chloroflexi bacterium]|nr:PQQ-binding-like beta-propeller repeat protein [Chloroflexota bacterium]